MGMGSAKMIIKNIVGEKRYAKLQFIKKKMKYSSKTGNCYCPCCDSHIKEWLSFRKYHWENKFNPTKFASDGDKCICPICNSLPRHRIEADWMNKNEENIYGRILIWAAEKCICEYLDRRKMEYLTADLYNNVAMVNENIEKTSFPSESFDLIICNHVLEHVENINMAIDDTYRILKKGGVVLITVPLDIELERTVDSGKGNSDEERKLIYGQADHLRLFGRDFYYRLCREKIIVEKYVGSDRCEKEILPVIAPAKYDSNIIFICRKV